MTRRSVLQLLAASSAFGKRWDESRFPLWTAEEIERLLTDSPWARPWNATVSVPLEQRMLSSFSQIGGIGLPSPIPRVPWPGGSRTGTTPGRGPIPADGPLSVRMEASAIIRWASALPIRRALVLQEFGRDGLDDPQALRILNRQDTGYVVELAGLPRNIAGGETEGIRTQLLKSAKLVVTGERPVSPSSVEVPSYGHLVTATMRFARREELDEERGGVEITAVLGAARVSERFKLRSMVYEGRVEL
jgi:hypothetical protein